MNSPYSNDIKEMTISPGCPWYEAQQSYGAPNVNWCEPIQCTILNEPANTWSNLAYILVGLILLKKMKQSPINAFPWAIISIGIVSFTYHATNNYLTQFLDFIGMFLMMSFLVAFTFNRVFKKLNLPFFGLYWFFVFINTTIFMIFNIIDGPVQFIMLINFIPIVIFEIWAQAKEKSFRHSKFFFLSFLAIVIAQGFAIMDIKRIYCEPDNLWLHGHVLWHIMSSVSMLFMGFHLKRMHQLNS